MQGTISIHNLSKHYTITQRKGLWQKNVKTVHALNDVSLEIRKGERVGLLGPNGAGKTTLIKCITTLLVPSSGMVRVNGHTLWRDDNAIRVSVGCMLMGERGLYWKLTGRENLLFFGALYHYSTTQRRQQAERLIERLNMGAIADRNVESYSAGQKMKLAFAKALINDAPILILDEPTNALDPLAARELRALVKELNDEGKTILYTTHNMAEAEELCERIVIVDKGQILASDTTAALKATLPGDSIVQLSGLFPPQMAIAFRALPGVTRVSEEVTNEGQRLSVATPDLRSLFPALLETVNAQHATLYQITNVQPTLEDVFMAYTGRSLAEDTRTA